MDAVKSTLQSFFQPRFAPRPPVDDRIEYYLPRQPIVILRVLPSNGNDVSIALIRVPRQDSHRRNRSPFQCLKQLRALIQQKNRTVERRLDLDRLQIPYRSVIQEFSLRSLKCPNAQAGQLCQDFPVVVQQLQLVTAPA